jgi:hypothetical protein
MLNMKHAIVTACALMAMNVTVSAGWFSKEPESTEKTAKEQPRMAQKYVLNVPDKKTEQELMSMLAGRKALEEDVGVLRRMLQSKIGLHGAIRKALSVEFGITPEMKWTYQADSMTVEEQQVSNESSNGSVSTNELFKRKLEDKAAEEKLLKMQKDAGRVVAQIDVLQELLKEQDFALKRQNGLLSAKFSLKPETAYYYDRNSMTLYEVLKPARQTARGVPPKQSQKANGNK